VGLNAQGYRDRREHGGPDDRRDHDERRGRVAGIIADCERRTDEFKVALKRALDRSPLGGTRREDDLNRDAAKLERAMNRLRDSWNADRDFERSRKHLNVALSAGQDINRSMSRHRLRGNVQREWDVVRNELNRLAEVFREPKIRWE
jgi:hypothetical protein